MIFVILALIFAVVITLVMTTVPMAVSRGGILAQTSSTNLALKYDAVLNDAEIKQAQRLTLLGPLVLGVAGFIFFRNLGAVFLGVFLGVVLPRIRLNQIIIKRKQKFADQLMDALMIMSSSFRGGLSLIQAVESVVEEMPDPIKQEFGIVLGENKMGVPLEESLNRLYKRMPGPALQQMITAILLARETGGNLALIFSRIINTMRERRKIEQSIKTLTIQGRIQAVVMTGLPVLFYFGVTATNPHFFDPMKASALGQKMLIGCAILWVLGAVSIWKISQFVDK